MLFRQMLFECQFYIVPNVIKVLCPSIFAEVSELHELPVRECSCPCQHISPSSIRRKRLFFSCPYL